MINLNKTHLPVFASAPSSPTNGDMYYDSTLNTARVYVNGSWMNLGGTSPKYTALIGDGSSTVYNITQSTHGLSSDSQNIAVVYDASTNKEVDVDIGVNPANGTITLTFASAPSTNAYRIVAFGSGTATSDYLSTLSASAISVTGATTATIGRMHVCSDSGSPANYTLTLPAVATDRHIGFRMAPNLTKFVTLDAGAGVTINGASTTLNGSINSSVTSLVVTSATKFPASGNFVIQLDSEQMLVTAGNGTTTWTVTRGINGTSAASHTTGVAVDWNRTRVMWANESAILHSDGSNWFKIAGVTYPMMCVMQDAASYSAGVAIANTTITKVNMAYTALDNTGAMADPSTNYRINIKRTGNYLSQCELSADANAITSCQSRLHKNGSFVFNTSRTLSNYDSLGTSAVPTLFCAGDYAETACYHSSGGSRNIYQSATILRLTEIPSW